MTVTQGMVCLDSVYTHIYDEMKYFYTVLAIKPARQVEEAAPLNFR